MNYNSVLLPDAMETSLLLNMPTYFSHNEQGDTPYSDVECPTKRASLWADMKKGRFLHVPASRE